MRPGAPSWASQILSNRLVGMSGSLAPPEAGAHHCQEHGLVGSGVFEVMGQVRVEGHAIAGGQLVAGAVTVQDDAALLDERGLPAAGLVHRRVARTAGDR